MAELTGLRKGTLFRNKNGLIPIEKNGVVAFYPIQNGSGSTIYDESRNNRNANTQGGSWATAPWGQAWDYGNNNSGNYIDTGYNAGDLGIGGDNPRTIVSWFYQYTNDTSSSGGNAGIWQVGSTGTNNEDYSLRQLSQTSNQFRVQLWGSNDQDFTYGSTDQWIMGTLRGGNGSITCFMDDNEKASTSVNLNTTNGNNLKFGVWQSDYLNGIAGPSFVYNRKLSNQEIINIYNKTKP